MPKGEKSPHSNEDSAQPKINKFKPKIKLLKKIALLYYYNPMRVAEV